MRTDSYSPKLVYYFFKYCFLIKTFQFVNSYVHSNCWCCTRLPSQDGVQGTTLLVTNLGVRHCTSCSVQMDSPVAWMISAFARTAW